MNLTIDLKQDKELRKEIIEMVKGVLVSISREEVLKVMTEAALKKLDNLDAHQLVKMIDIPAVEQREIFTAEAKLNISSRVDNFMAREFDNQVNRITRINQELLTKETERMSGLLTDMFAKKMRGD